MKNPMRIQMNIVRITWMRRTRSVVMMSPEMSVKLVMMMIEVRLEKMGKYSIISGFYGGRGAFT